MVACIYAAGSPQESLLALASSFSPLVEDTAPGVVIFSILGLGKLIGSAEAILEAIMRAGAAMGIQGNLAISADPDTAVLAAKFIRGITLIPAGKEADQLGSLPVQILPAAPELIETLERWGIRTLAELAELPELGFVARFGEEGTRVLRLARGETRRTLHVLEPPENYQRRVALEYPQRLLEPLLLVLSALLRELMQGLSFNRVTLGLTLEKRPLHQRTLEFPVPVCDPQVMLKQLQFDLEAHPPSAAITAVDVQLRRVPARSLQHGLFVPQSPAPEKVQLTLARLAVLMGEGNVGSPELLDTHRRDAFVMRAFAPDSASSAVAPVTLRFAFRYYRPALAAQVHLRAERPVLLNAQPVLAAAGPWRASGDWWTELPWSRQEWDVELGDGGLYRVYKTSRSWFLEGMYD